MKHLPLDVSTLKMMIERDYVYIDKTEHIFNLFNKGNRFYFLSRPRRFGKTLLISTLKEFFLGNKNLFKDLWVGESVEYQWPQYPVIHLDFSTIANKTEAFFDASLSLELKTIATSYGIDVSAAQSSNDKLKILVRTLAQKNEVVLLIDEYDYPLLCNLEFPIVANALQNMMRNFYSMIKALDPHLRAVFITGVSKFSKTSIFSGMNNVNDITLKPEGATLLGYTESEIRCFLQPHLEDFAKVKNLSVDTIMQEMQAWYNGYRFSENDETAKMYNPFSVLHCLQNKQFKNYWFETGTPGFLVHLLKKQYQFIENIENIELSGSSLGTFDINDMPIIPILFQTGYLTIQHYNKELDKYTLSYPNHEVAESFKKYLVSALSHTDIVGVEASIYQIKHALEICNIDLFCNTLRSLFANIPYLLHIPEEKYYHSLFQFMLDLMGLEAQSEIMTSKGRIDLVVQVKSTVFIFEIKFKDSAENALKQILEKRYYEKYTAGGKKIVLIGLSFHYKDKTLNIDWVNQEMAS